MAEWRPIPLPDVSGTSDANFRAGELFSKSLNDFAAIAEDIKKDKGVRAEEAFKVAMAKAKTPEDLQAITQSFANNGDLAYADKGAAFEAIEQAPTQWETAEIAANQREKEKYQYGQEIENRPMNEQIAGDELKVKSINAGSNLTSAENTKKNTEAFNNFKAIAKDYTSNGIINYDKFLKDKGDTPENRAAVQMHQEEFVKTQEIENKYNEAIKDPLIKSATDAAYVTDPKGERKFSETKFIEALKNSSMTEAEKNKALLAVKEGQGLIDKANQEEFQAQITKTFAPIDSFTKSIEGLKDIDPIQKANLLKASTQIKVALNSPAMMKMPAETRQFFVQEFASSLMSGVDPKDSLFFDPELYNEDPALKTLFKQHKAWSAAYSNIGKRNPTEFNPDGTSTTPESTIRKFTTPTADTADPNYGDIVGNSDLTPWQRGGALMERQQNLQQAETDKVISEQGKAAAQRANAIAAARKKLTGKKSNFWELFTEAFNQMGELGVVQQGF